MRSYNKSYFETRCSALIYVRVAQKQARYLEIVFALFLAIISEPDMFLLLVKYPIIGTIWRVQTKMEWSADVWLQAKIH